MTENLKIAFVLTQSLESPDGIGRCGPLSRELVKLGHHVDIFALHPDFTSLKDRVFEMEGVNVHYVAPMHVRKQSHLKSYYSPLRLFSIVSQASWKLSQSTLKSNADIIHVFKPHPMNSLAGVAAKYLRAKQLYLDIDDYEAESGHFGNNWQKWFVANFEKRIPRLTKAVTTNTTFMRHKLNSWGIPQDRVYYLPNGVERSRFLPPPKDKSQYLIGKFGLRSKKVVTFIGSLSLPSHPVDLLVDAFARVHSQIPNTILMLVGGGEAYQQIEQQVERMGLGDVVRFSGKVPPEEVSHYYYLAHVSVDPVQNDEVACSRLPLKLFESWACGIPFVSGDVGDRRMLLSHPLAGLLAKPGDPDSLATEIIRVLDNQELSKSLKQYGLERIKSYYWDVLVKKLEMVYLDASNDTGWPKE